MFFEKYKLQIIGFLVLIFLGILFLTGLAQADDRLRPNTSINELTDTSSEAWASGDYVPKYDASRADWVKMDLTPIINYTSATTLDAILFASDADLDLDNLTEGTVFYHSGNETLYFCSGTCGPIVAP